MLHANLACFHRGPEHYLAWARGVALPLGGGQDVLDFYRDGRARELYRHHIRSILTRANVFNGKKYRDDPAIMAWDVMNEPRCPGEHIFQD